MAFGNLQKKPTTEDFVPFAWNKNRTKKLAIAAAADDDENENPETINYGFGRVFKNEPAAENETPTETGLGIKNPQRDAEADAEAERFTVKPGINDQIRDLEGLIYDPDRENDPRNKPNRWASGAQMAAKYAADVLMNGGSWAQAIGAALGGFGGGAINRKAAADLKHGQKLAFLYKQREQMRADEDRSLQRAMKQLAMDNTRFDNMISLERINEAKQDRQRKVDDRQSREKTSRMNAVAGMFKNLPAYDPNDPRFAEITQALDDVDLPITPKDAKKKVDLKQDQRTGEWTVIVTDPISGNQEVRSVMKDGQPYKSTPTVVMQGEYGILRQNDQQEFQATENEKNRRQAATLARERMQIQRDNLALAQRRLDEAIKNNDAKAKASAEQDLREQKERLIRLKAFIKGNQYTKDNAELLQEIDDLENEE